MRVMKELANRDSSSLRHSGFLAEMLGLVELVQASIPQGGQKEFNDFKEEVHSLRRRKNDPANYFLIEEIRKYVRIKPNRLGKQNFMGANGTFTSIGHSCFSMKTDLEEYMEYDVGDICKDDWKLAQKLMVHGCDPLPRRRCLSRAPKLYSKPFPITESMWKLPDDRNVRWSNYRCKNFACLANKTSVKGFFKCADCFSLVDHEMPRWTKIQPSELNTTSDFLISEVLDIKPREIRIGLDFSVGTGTFAARMREFNVTIVSAIINIGAPFNEMIALRGLVPLYLTINQRLPFFDNTLDIIHTTRFLDGWIDFMLLDFVLYDWDRVLRPGGLLWIDSFFCLKEDLNDYLEGFKTLRYKKHKWVVVPKSDKNDREECCFAGGGLFEGASSITFVFLEQYLNQFRQVARVGELVDFDACMDIMDLLYETEEMSRLYDSPRYLAAAILVVSYIITIPKQQWEFPLLPWDATWFSSSYFKPLTHLLFTVVNVFSKSYADVKGWILAE
ncbi:hypothetical protein IFM89_021912 [Coptis chinensis]|uniref:Uncharacterized protein n=1 Tax=Coptis chinensis TaxID=261450 RepID=A0A835HGE7_9MAGN|nr:hypothetical protein IFM89_021912 [Coptis chinensis]